MNKKQISKLLLCIFLVSILALFLPHASAASVSTWDGKTLTKPTISSGYIIIDSASDLAWVAQKQDALGATKIKLKYSIDMGNYTLKSLPSSIIEFNGNKKTIYNMNLSGGLMTAKNNVYVYNLNLNDINVNAKTDAGILVNVVNGKTTIKGCTIVNSSVKTTKGNAGGMIGKIVRASETDRSIKFGVTIQSCSVNDTKITASAAEGKFVGLFSGYDRGETLTIKACSSNATIADYKSLYLAKNQSVFLAAVPAETNNFIGAQTYYRGVVKYDAVEFIPKWDGKTKVTPLLANPTYDGSSSVAGTNKFAIYTSFDLAGARNKTASPAALYIKNHIDMNGQGADGKFNIPTVFAKSKCSSKDDNNFTPFSTVATLIGNSKTIYNLKIEQLEKTSGAFILSASGTTSHKNINFDSCCTVVTHKKVSTDAKAYGGILIASAGGTSYTMSGVNVTNSKVCALQKVGTLAGCVTAKKSTVSKCTVTNCFVENYKCTISETFDSGNKTFKGRTVRVKASFYPHGEVGGAIGFVQGTSTISNCSVTKSTIHAYGQNDKMATVSGSTLGQLAIKAAGYYLVPGRHVSTFIGDIRSSSTVKVTGCKVDAATKCTNRWDKHNNGIPYIGQAYYVQFLDTTGKTYVDGKKIILADCNRYTSR